MDYFSGIWTAFNSLIRTFKFNDILDITIVSFLIYNLIKLIRESRAGQLVKGIIVVLIAYLVAYQLHLEMLSTVLNNFVQFAAFGLLVVFQPELRRALEQIGRSKIGSYFSVDNIIHNEEEAFNKSWKNVINNVVSAISIFNKTKTGALIVFERKTKLGEIIDTGMLIKAQPSEALISNIFYDKAPLHDGAAIIRDCLLHAGGCILPLTKNDRLGKDLGTRHRAALGISENSDAVAVVVSEETGDISVAVNGEIKRHENIGQLRNELEDLIINPGRAGYKNILSSFRKVKKND